jgi:hypothetical protein
MNGLSNQFKNKDCHNGLSNIKNNSTNNVAQQYVVYKKKDFKYENTEYK